MSTKLTYLLKIHLIQSINCFSTKKKKLGIKHLKIFKAFIDHSQAIDDVYENLEDLSTKEEKCVKIVDMEANTISKLIVAE